MSSRLFAPWPATPPARTPRWLIALAVLAIGLLIGLVWHDRQTAWTTDARGDGVTFKLAVYWGLWLVWPWMAGLAVFCVREARARDPVTVLAGAAMLVASGCIAWARFIEPSQLQVVESRLGTACQARVALISDLHIGLYMRAHDLQRVVDRLNELQVDAVLVAGDWTYEPPHDLAGAFAPLRQVKHRMVGVLGNHDEQAPGPPLKQALQTALAAQGVDNLDGRRTTLGQCELVGLGNESTGSARADLQGLVLQASAVDGAHRIVLTHNPDSAYRLPAGYAAWTLAGHTHGGQVRLPRVTDRMLDQMTRGRFHQGRYKLPTTQVFVTSGIGIDMLPLRFRVTPRIDVLTL